MEKGMTRQQRLRIAVLVAGLGLLPGATTLAEGFYFGAAGGISKVDLGSKSELDTIFFGGPVASSLDDTGNSFGVQIGYRWNSYLAVELGYVDFGKAVYKADIPGFDTQFTARFRSSGPTLSALGTLPVGERFDLYGRGGVFYADTRYRERLDDMLSDEFISGEVSGNSFDLLVGVGAAWNINATHSLRIEYQRFLDVGDEDETGEADVDLVTFGIVFR
jgi:OOP family OmpA-OmpF porin